MPEYLDLTTEGGETIELFDNTTEDGPLMLTLRIFEDKEKLPDTWAVGFLSLQDVRDLVKACTEWLWTNGEVI